MAFSPNGLTAPGSGVSRRLTCVQLPLWLAVATNSLREVTSTSNPVPMSGTPSSTLRVPARWPAAILDRHCARQQSLCKSGREDGRCPVEPENMTLAQGDASDGSAPQERPDIHSGVEQAKIAARGTSADRTPSIGSTWRSSRNCHRCLEEPLGPVYRTQSQLARARENDQRIAKVERSVHPSAVSDRPPPITRSNA